MKRFTGYEDRDMEDHRLWSMIRVDFEDFKEEHFNQLSSSIWNNVTDYCYSHGLWIDFIFETRPIITATAMLKAIKGNYSDKWTADQIKWVADNYACISRKTLKRGQELKLLLK